MLLKRDVRDAAAEGCREVPPNPSLSLPSPCSSPGDAPHRVRRCPLSAPRALRALQLHTAGRGHRLWAAAQGPGVPEPPLRVPEPQPPCHESLTVTFHPLVDEPIQQRAAVVAEGGAGVCVDFKFVFAPGILGGKQRTKIINLHQMLARHICSSHSRASWLWRCC